MRVVGIGFLLLFAAACGLSINMSKVNKCPVGANGKLSEAMRVAITRPLCEAECLPVDMALSEITSAISKAKACYESQLQTNLDCYEVQGVGCGGNGLVVPKTNDELRQEVRKYEKSILRRSLYNGSCKTNFHGVASVCVFSRAAMLLVNEMLHLCADVESSEQEAPSDNGSVLSCNPLYTLPLRRDDSYEKSLDDAAAKAPFDNPDWIANQGTDSEKIELRAFYVEHIEKLEKLIERTSTEGNDFAAELGDLQSWIASAGNEYNGKLVKKLRELKRQKAQLATLVNDLVEKVVNAQKKLEELDEQNPHLNQDSRKMKLAIRAEKRRQFKVSSRQSGDGQATCKSNDECIDHVWHANVYLYTNCRSICTSYICQDRLTLKYCVEQTLAWGNTKPNCHANAWSRSYCFDGY
uniref:Uncharacterized protein n=1 Tax=Rhodosorus marinus TaxID=101924 RepID=A0A7S3ELP5_9RHOD|mmetsp:Transcript_45858/g.178185  ORF Transcript_45858/g.178185 Transcript_45858/m.178185 type:complete len:410 (+) Transcript_45858:145-1374(+)